VFFILLRTKGEKGKIFEVGRILNFRFFNQKLEFQGREMFFYIRKTAKLVSILMARNNTAKIIVRD